jgi:hypothetical protein
MKYALILMSLIAAFGIASVIYFKFIDKTEQQ